MLKSYNFTILIIITQVEKKWKRVILSHSCEYYGESEQRIREKH